MKRLSVFLNLLKAIKENNPDNMKKLLLTGQGINFEVVKMKSSN